MVIEGEPEGHGRDQPADDDVARHAPRSIRVGRQDGVEQAGGHVQPDVDEHVSGEEGQVLREQRVDAEVGDDDLDQQQHDQDRAEQRRRDPGQRRRRHRDRGQVRPRTSVVLRVRIGEVLEAVHAAEAAVLLHAPIQKLDVDGQHDDHDDRHREQERHERPDVPRAGAHERQRVEERPARAELPDQGRDQHQHDREDRRRVAGLPDADAHRHALREQVPASGERDEGNERHHADAVQREDRVEPVGEESEHPRLDSAHEQAGQPQDEEQHEGSDDPEQGEAVDAAPARVVEPVARGAGHAQAPPPHPAAAEPPQPPTVNSPRMNEWAGPHSSSQMTVYGPGFEKLVRSSFVKPGIACTWATRWPSGS